MQDFISIHSRSQIQLGISGVAAQTEVLVAGGMAGIFDAVSNVDCYIKVGVTANDVTVNSGYPLYAGQQIPVEVPAGYRLGAITSGAAGTLKLHQVR